MPGKTQWIAVPLAALAIAIGVRASIALPSNAQMAFTVISVDAKSGNVLWNTVVSRGPLGRIGDNRANGASPTPATDGELVFVHFGGVTAGLDFNGEVRWKHIDAQYASSVVYGATSSPIIADDRVIVVQDRERSEQARKSHVAAYEKSSGRILWRVEPPDARNSYGTPLAFVGNQPPAMITVTSQALLAYDLRNGSRLWSVPVPVEEIVSSMVTSGDRLYISGGSFAAVTMSLRLAEKSNALAPVAQWSTNRGANTSVSPVFYGGMLFTVSQNGIASCYDGHTGDRLWRERLVPGEYFASPIAADGKVYASNEEGMTTVFEASAKFKIVAQNALGESIYSSPAISRGSIILRTDKALYCIKKK